jgi:aspartyl-tRNA(Asn)/glutamyl-tRNA(Gln) amidotransferase subunit B
MILGNLFSLMNRDGVERERIGETKVPAAAFAALVKMVDEGKINKATGVTVLTDLWENGGDPVKLVEEKGLAQISDTSVIEGAVADALAANGDMVKRYLAGEDKLFGPLMGSVMKALKGQGNPQVVRELVQKQLEAMKQG